MKEEKGGREDDAGRLVRTRTMAVEGGDLRKGWNIPGSVRTCTGGLASPWIGSEVRACVGRLPQEEKR